jgi:RimJ/RimL family protein N-acetyltransferase
VSDIASEHNLRDVLEDPRPDDVPWLGARWVSLDAVTLDHHDVTLRLVAGSDVRVLFEVLDDDRCWAHVAGRPRDTDALKATIENAPAVGRHMWVVVRRGEIIGTTSFLDVSVHDARLEIGSTMYAPSQWGSDLNPTCKFLLMSFAFDQLGMGRVQLKTDIRNVRSRNAIERLGARHEGVLRRYQRRADGTVRDTVMYSVTAEDWPTVRAGLLERIPPVE